MSGASAMAAEFCGRGRHDVKTSMSIRERGLFTNRFLTLMSIVAVDGPSCLRRRADEEPDPPLAPSRVVERAGTRQQHTRRHVMTAPIASVSRESVRCCGGADIHTVAQLLGHKDLPMAARYQHLSPAFLADAVATLDRVFGFLVTKALPEQIS
jgi:integrase